MTNIATVLRRLLLRIPCWIKARETGFGSNEHAVDIRVSQLTGPVRVQRLRHMCVEEEMLIETLLNCKTHNVLSSLNCNTHNVLSPLNCNTHNVLSSLNWNTHNALSPLNCNTQNDLSSLN